MSRLTSQNLSPITTAKLVLARMNAQPAKRVRGPERATFFERLISAFRIPYVLGCLVLAFILGPPGTVLLAYVQTSNMDEAIAMSISFFFGLELPYWVGVFALAIFSAILFYCPYLIRYMRLKLVAAKPALLPILPYGDEAFQKAFSRVSQTRPPIAVGAVLIVLVIIDCLGNFLEFGIAPANLVFVVMFSCLWAMVAGTFVWVYFASVWGLHKLGQDSIKLKSFREDKTLGARPIGLLSLSFAFTYLTGPGSFLLLAVMFPAAAGTFFAIMVGFLILSGVILFFFPLNSTHKKMLEAKQLEQETLRQQYIKVHESLNASESPQLEVSEALDRLTNIITIDVTKAEIDAIPIWPVDVPILSRLVTLIFSIIGILIANYVMNFVLDWI